MPLPLAVTGVWGALRLPAAAAEDRLAEAGRRLADALLAGDDQRLLAGVLDRLTPGDSAAVVLSAAGDGCPCRWS